MSQPPYQPDPERTGYTPTPPLDPWPGAPYPPPSAPPSPAPGPPWPPQPPSPARGPWGSQAPPSGPFPASVPPVPPGYPVPPPNGLPVGHRPPKARNRRWIIPAIIAGVVAVCCGGILISTALGDHKPNTNTADTTATTPAAAVTIGDGAAPAATHAPATQAPPAGPKVLLKVNGNGIKKTQIFTTGAEWTLGYSYDCSGFGGQGNFIVTEYDSGGDPTDVLVNALDAKGSDTVPQHGDAGSHYLEINSECSWSVTVTG